MSRMRHELPPELLDNVLARLPMHVLCRCRLVCKSWSHLITHPEFASRHVQARRQPSLLISPKVMRFNPNAMETYREMHEQGLNIPDSVVKMAARRDWEILDMAEKRFYTLSDSSIEGHLLERDGWHSGWAKHTLASDGGLIYALYEGSALQHHVVYNPMGKNWHQLPQPEFSCQFDQAIVVMSVDSATQSYKIVIMEARCRPLVEEVFLYDSAAMKWRSLCKVPTNCRAWSSVFLKGVFYALFVETSVLPLLLKLYSCDLETGGWSHIDVALPRLSHLQDKGQLVVSLGRLFLVEYTGVSIFIPNVRCMTTWETVVANNNASRKQLIDVIIWEILLAEREVIKVAEAPEYAKYPRRMLDRPRMIVGNPVVAVGCGDSIVVSSLLRRRLRFDLVWKCWEELPSNRQASHEHRGIFVGTLDLDMRGMEELRVPQEVAELDSQEGFY